MLLYRQTRSFQCMGFWPWYTDRNYGGHQPCHNVIISNEYTHVLIEVNFPIGDTTCARSYDSESTYGHLDGFKKKTTMKNDVSMGDLIVDFVTVILDGSIRMETSIRRCPFTKLGALALDWDLRFFINFFKERANDTNYTSSVELYKACNALARLGQIAVLMNVDDLEDVLDLISSCNRKGC